MEHIPTNYKLDKKYIFSRYYNKEMDYYDIKLMMITYRDYLDMMKELKVRENLYPRDIEQAHDELVELKQFQEEQKEREGAKWRILTKKLYKKYSNCVPENKKYQLYIPQRQVDLMDLGKDMDNCVGSCSYGKDEKNGKCLIVAVYSNKKPIACCELNPKSQYKIEQIYAPGNEKLKSRAPRLFVNQFINKVKEARI